jgi:hypothetical protein
LTRLSSTEQEKKRRKKMGKQERTCSSTPVEDDDVNIIFQEDNIPLDFQDLDKTLRCVICASLFDKAVTIKDCGHTYCSVCIRNHWVTSRNGVHRQVKKCPTCRQEVSQDVDKALVMNRNIQEGVKIFKQMLLKTHKSSSQKQETEDSPSSSSSSSSPSCRKKRRRTESVRKLSNNVNYDEDVDEDEDDYEEERDNDEDEDIDEEEDQELPIQKTMDSRNLGRMKKNDLRKLCKEYNLPSNGNDEELKTRFRSFQSMWNAEVDSINPLKPSDLVKKLKETEQAQREEKNRAIMSGVANDSQYLKKFNTSIENGNEVTTSGNRNFDKKLDGNFDKLTEQLRERSKKKESGFSVAAKQVTSAKKKSSTTAAEVIEVIDIDSSSSSDSSSETTDQLKPSAAMNKENNNYKLTSFSEKSSPPSSSSSAARGTPAPESRQHFVKNQNSTSSKKKRHSRSPSSLATWICNHCTYENKGVDHLCLMCRNKRT